MHLLWGGARLRVLGGTGRKLVIVLFSQWLELISQNFAILLGLMKSIAKILGVIILR